MRDETKRSKKFMLRKTPTTSLVPCLYQRRGTYTFLAVCVGKFLKAPRHYNLPSTKPKLKRSFKRH